MALRRLVPERRPVRMRVARAHRVIGVDVPVPDIAEIFSRLALPATLEGKGAAAAFTVTPPSYRFDILIEEDLIEEVARVYGFERIPAQPPRARAAMRARREDHRSLHALRATLAAAGYQEVINFSFVEPVWEADLAGCADPIRLLNPIASQLSVMRTSLMAGLLDNVRYNVNRRATRVRVFEVGRVFLRQPGAGDEPLEVAGLRQPMRIAAAAFGPVVPEQWGVATRAVGFYDVK